MGGGYRDQGLVFAQPDGGPVTPGVFGKRFERLVNRAGVARVSFHGLRHTHITNLLRAGVNPKIASEREGHTSVAITLDLYSHVAPDLQEDVARTVDATLRPILDEQGD